MEAGEDCVGEGRSAPPLSPLRGQLPSEREARIATLLHHQSVGDFTGKAGYGAAETVVTSSSLTMPERQSGGSSGRRGDDHTVARNVLNLPCGGAECDHIADTRFIDHLLIEFAHTALPFAGIHLRQYHGVQASIRNRTA